MPFYKNKNNIELYYEIINNNPKEHETPIVMVHGFGSSAGFFKEQIKVLREFYKIIVFDAEGHGKSGKNPNEDLARQLITETVQDLQELLKKLEIKKKIGIIGHSLVGGAIAQKMALLFPESIDFIILLNAGTMYIDNAIRNSFWNLLPQMVRMEFKDLFLENIDTLLDKTLPYIRRAILGNMDNKDDFFYDKLDGTIENEIFSMVEEPIDPVDIKCDTLIIGGELDNYAPLWMQKELAEKIENSRFEIIPYAGHFGPAQNYHEYNEIILSFLSKLNL